MADYSYAIGASVLTLQNLEDDLGLPPPHPAPYQEWAVTYEAGDGRQYGDGFPSCVWRWDYLTYTHVSALRAFCPGKSANVYIRTLEPDGISYANYSAIILWPNVPQDTQFQMGRVSINFFLTFTHLQAA